MVDRPARRNGAPVVVVLAGCTLFLLLGFLFKGQCLDGRFGENSYRRLCYNDLQPLFGPRLHRVGADGAQELVFPYVHGYLDEEGLHEGAIEYPVLTGLFMYVSALPVDDADSYLKVSAVLLAPFALIAAYLLARMAGWRALLFALAPAVVLYSFHNWDLLVVAAAVAGLWFWSRDRPAWAAIMFGVGAALKMWPIFLLGPLFLDELQRRGLKRAFAAPLVGVVTLVGINLPFALANLDGWIATYEFHQRRGPNFDSIWWVGWPEWTAQQVNTVSSALTAVTFLGILALSWWIARARRSSYPFLQASAALLAAFLLWNKVHSPQYTLWLLPFFVVLRVNVLWWVAYAAADIAVYVGVFRWFYAFGANVDQEPALSLMRTGVWVRAGLLVALIIVFLVSRSAREGHPGADPEPEDEEVDGLEGSPAEGRPQPVSPRS